MWIIFDEESFLHQVSPFHPEKPERIIPLKEELEKIRGVEFIKPKPLSEEDISILHSPSYIKEFKEAIGKYPYLHTTDCPLSLGTYRAALISASGAILAVDGMMEGKTRGVFSILRPPGHHALKNKAMGFCYFNNIALAAIHLVNKWKLKRVCIIDWDAHHGNGTQEIFYETSKVFYTSLHGHPLITYPGTGFSEERGKGEGEGYTLNFPLFPEVDDDEILRIFKEKLLPPLEKYKPEFCLISCGFDGHKEDPLVPNLNFSDELFEKFFEETLNFAKNICNGRVGFILEGGYNPEVVKRLGLKLVKKIIQF